MEKKKGITPVERSFLRYLQSTGYPDSTASCYVRRLRSIKALDQLMGENLDPYIAAYETGSRKHINALSHNTYSCALKRFRQFQIARNDMELLDFIGAVVRNARTGERYRLHKITAPYIEVVTEKPGSSGYPAYYVYEVINEDPISEARLVFEDPTLTAPFRKRYEAYCRTEDARWENYAYWMHKE